MIILKKPGLAMLASGFAATTKRDSILATTVRDLSKMYRNTLPKETELKLEQNMSQAQVKDQFSYKTI